MVQAKGKKTPLVAAISCSGCFDLNYAAENVKSNENVSYKIYLDQQTRVCVKRHIQNDNSIDREKFLEILAKEVDCQKIYDRFIYDLPDYSYKDPLLHAAHSDYKYRVQTGAHYEHLAAGDMDKVQITTLILHADDDPIVGGDHVDWKQVEANRAIITMRTRRGGHVAWYEGWLPFGETWCDRIVCNFISGVLETHSQTNFIIDVVKRMQLDEAKIIMAGNSKTKPDKRSNKGSTSTGTGSATASGPISSSSSSSRSGFSGPSAIARICSASDILDFYEGEHS
mmetsp:Transcript_24895/g.44284  ORF Transcript_24895/g.44284 Transcript_24895/m.44284 type:complete len:283 (-) Transcript_24895:43-891(-)